MRFQGLAVVLAILIGGFFSEVAHASWKTFAGNGDKKSVIRYVHSFPSGSCVIIRHNETLEISAREDPWRGKEVFQFVEIRYDGTFFQDTVAVESEKTLDAISDEAAFPEFKFSSEGYDVFSKNCKALAKELPPEVKAMFHGKWGIE